ncbi:MAG: hypothetical protein PHC53_05345 [Patescibacteria group bacterium]|nr:hypothetical protein [Patescibacteria group bacterium]
MKIGIIGSMQMTERMLELKEKLESMGHAVIVSGFASEYVGKSDEEKESIKLYHKNNCDAIREFWTRMQDCNAVLVANYEKHGMPNYIGGNTLMEIGFAYVLNQKIFLLNPVPEIPFYKSEVEAVKPIIINGDLSLIS